MAVTMKDIAAKSGVSRAVVSLVLNGREQQLGIAENTRRKVLAAADELGYCRNELARAVVTGNSRIIGMVSALSMGCHEYISRIMAGVFEELSERGYSLKIFYLKDHNETQIIRQLRESRIAGVICHASEHRALAELMENLSKLKIPTVTVNLSADKFGVGIVSDDASGIEQAVDHFYEYGHRKIAYLGCSGDTEYIRNRRLGFRRGMEKHNLVPHFFEPSPSGTRPDSVFEQADRLYSAGFRAVVTETDVYAMELMQWAYRNHIQIPEELSMTGFSNAAFSGISVVPLTTAAQPLSLLGTAAAGRLVDWIEGDNEDAFHEASNISFPVKLLVRNSVHRIG